MAIVMLCCQWKKKEMLGLCDEVRFFYKQTKTFHPDRNSAPLFYQVLYLSTNVTIFPKLSESFRLGIIDEVVLITL
jgi:hypothetical protein